VAAEAYPKQDTEFTREGTLAHEVAEAYVSNSPTFKGLLEREGVTAEMVDCAEAYRNYIEEQVKDNLATVLLEQRVDFSPWVPDGFGTADCIILQGDTMDVIDYKFGKGVAVSAEDNPQMKLYGLGALNDYGFACDIQKVRLHIFQPRINNISVDELTVDELLTWADKTVKPTAEKAAKGKGKYTPGQHCRFCPHAGKCRALTRVCTEFVTTSHGMKAPVEVLAPWDVSEVLAMEPLISLWLKRVKDQALTTLLNGEDIPGYKVVEGKQGNRKWTDELQVAEALKDAGYSMEDYTETKLLSPAAMDKSLGKKKVAELLDSLIDRAPGAPTVVPETDKRPVYDRLAEAQKDFN
jgi:RecB family exonuclease